MNIAPIKCKVITELHQDVFPPLDGKHYFKFEYDHNSGDVIMKYNNWIMVMPRSVFLLFLEFLRSDQVAKLVSPRGV